MLLFYLLTGETSTCVAFAHLCMTSEPLFTQYLSTYISMTDVRLGACTLDAGGIATEDTDVVQHGRFFKKLLV